jgi:hypothetical protein
MADPHIISVLSAKYARLRGEQAKLIRESRSIAHDMHHIECVIRLFREEWEGRKITAIRPRKPVRWSRNRNGVRYAFEALKAASEPLTANEIASRVAVLARLPEPDKATLWAMASAINTGLKRHANCGVVDLGGRPKRWTLKPPAANTLPIPGLPVRP